MLIILASEELKKCIEFSYKCADNQQEIEFGQVDTPPRRRQEIGRDNLIGKIAEVAFAKMLKDCFEIDIKLDFEFYPRGVWDKNDTEINCWQIDIKGTRQGGRWMLIEWSKLDFRQKRNDLPHLFVMTSVHWDRDKDMPTGRVNLLGCATLYKLRPGEENTLVLRKGDRIPNTKMPLQADNYAIHFNDLEQNWSKAIGYITNKPPPDTRHYPNPYTGKTLNEEHQD